MDPVKGQIIVSLMSRDGPSGSGNPLAIVGPMGDILGPNDEREPPMMNQTTNDHPLTVQWNSNDNEAAAVPASATNDTSSSPKTPPQLLNLTNGSNELISRRHSSEILLSLGNENCSPSRSNDASA